MMNITIKTIPHDRQRYDTVGDWRFTGNGDLEIRVSAMDDWRMEALVGIHEAIEALLCKDHDITTEMVDAYDKEFEARREPGDESEPGDAPGAPYGSHHFFATTIERLLGAQLGMNWTEYDEKIRSL